MCIILYADKSKLSTFGTQQGYPVIARCANLPADIRNGRGVGGGCIVGLLPIVCMPILQINSHVNKFCQLTMQLQEKEDAAESRKKGYVDFKRVIWHTSVEEILRSAHQISKIGYTIFCDDDVERLIYIIILILSADFEEQ